MKNKYWVIWIVLIIFLGLNYNSFINFYYNSFWDYEKTNNLVWKYNIWTESYINKEYSKAIDSFSASLDENKNPRNPLSGGIEKLSFRVLHNIANSYFKFWEDKDLKEKIALFTMSVESYREALNIKFDEQTQKNLEFVLEKLRIAKLEKEKQEQEKEEEKKQEEESEESENENKWEDNKQEDKNESWEENNKEKDWEKNNESEEWWEDQEWWGSEWWKQWENTDGKLSEETKKILEQKEDELQKLQEEIWQYYNKNYKEKIDPFNNFDQFFDNGLLDENEEKDW